MSAKRPHPAWVLCAEHGWGGKTGPCPYCELAALRAENERLNQEIDRQFNEKVQFKRSALKQKACIRELEATLEGIRLGLQDVGMAPKVQAIIAAALGKGAADDKQG